MLYRLLRQDESIEDGLWAKDPNSETSVFLHVTKGSYGKSKYISTCGSYEAVAYLKSKSKQPGKIVKIDEDKLLSNNVKIIDLRNQKTRDNHKDNSATAELINTFNNFANKFQEVLLVGHVPKSCLIVD